MNHERKEEKFNNHVENKYFLKPKREFKKIKKQNESAGNELINKLSNCEIQHCNIIKCFTKFFIIK